MPNAGGAAEPSVSRVADEESVYRSIWLNAPCFRLGEDGSVYVSPQAFSDRSKQVSLFRHILCDNPPLSNPPRLGADQAVARLLANRIREITPLSHQAGNNVPVDYVIDIIPDVTDGQHLSHAVVISNPSFETNRVFEKLKIRLAQIVEALVVPPPSEFIDVLRGSI